MKAKDFKGIIPPIQTSFTADGELNEQGIRNLIRFTLPHVHAYYPIGTYGVGPLMTLDDRKKALEIILDEVNGKVPVIAHVGCADTKSVIELAKHAKAAGASAVASISPYYSPNLPDDMLFQYHADIIDAVQDEDFALFYHNCGNTVPQLAPDIYQLGARGYHFGNCIDLKDVLPAAPSDVLVMGNVDPAGELRNGTPDSVRACVTHVMEQCGSYPNFVISSGCDIPPMSPWENLDAFFQAVTEYYAGA